MNTTFTNFVGYNLYLYLYIYKNKTKANSKWRSLYVFLHDQQPEPRLNIKTVFPRYGDSHVKDKTVARPSYLLAWESLYW